MIVDELSIERTADVAVVANFLVDARLSSAPPVGIEFVDGSGNPSDFSAFSSLVAPCDLKQIYVVVGSIRPNTPIFSEWRCRQSQAVVQAGFRIWNGKIESVTFGPLQSVRISSRSHSQRP